MRQQKKYSQAKAQQKSFWLVVLLLIPFLLCAQEVDSLLLQNREGALLFSDNTIKNPIRVRLHTGMSVFNSSGGGTGTFSFINPNISFQLNTRLAIHTSFAYSYGTNAPFLTVNTDKKHVEVQNTDVALGLFAVGASYIVRPNLIVSGGVWKEMSLQPAFSEPRLNPRVADFESEGITIGIQYKPTENSEINAVFDYSRGNSLYYNPFMNPLLPYEPTFLMHNRSLFGF
ncbi:MAG: outer membrane protein transport protein [Lentimicrobiaceae bacterium]|jgi:hypothetical protein|nr:outer membrane protein transport protein [Lentimicrobiaceae bacterium]